MHDSTTCPICSRLSIHGSMSDQEFFSFLAACRNELTDKQERFQQRMSSAAPWSYEMADCSPTICGQRFPITPVGTWNSEHQSWLWAWANDTFPPMARETSRKVQALHAVTGFRVFLDPGIKASLADAQDFAALAVHHLGASGFFRTTSSGTTLYLAVHEPE
jgi:hypothetical protein